MTTEKKPTTAGGTPTAKKPTNNAFARPLTPSPALAVFEMTGLVGKHLS